jgi:antitoxin MazE
MSDATAKTGKIARWGNSAAVRLPSAVLAQAQLRVDDAVEVIARADEIVIRRQRPRVTLDALLAQFDPEKHRHDPLLDDPSVGIETL